MTLPRPSGAPEHEPIAVVGVSALMPGSGDAGGFWRTVVQGRDLVTEVPPTHWLISDYYDPDPTAEDKTYGCRGAFLDPVEFDPLAYGLPPSALPATDTSQPLTLLATRQLLDDLARYGPPAHDPDRVSVILGTGALDLAITMAGRMQRPVWASALRASGVPRDQADAICDRIAAHYVPWQEATFPGMLGNVVAGRVANRFDFHGSNYATDAACASSLAAVSSAINELRLRQADMVVTGGVDTLSEALWFTSFSKTPALSPTGDCRPFSADADGMVLGEGIVLFALKRLGDAERDNDAVYAVIRGLGSSSDGAGTAVYTPTPSGQVRALRRAYQAAGYPPETVELVEAHGTGTRAGDAAEVAALREVFAPGEVPVPVPWCALGSAKSQFGHTKGAAGAVGLLKAVLALHHKVLPPTIKVTRPDPRLGLENSPFQLNTTSRPWVRGAAHPRRASVSSFGFGGTNFHLAVEEYVPRAGGRRAYRTRTASSELVVVSAATEQALLGRCRDVTEDERPLFLVARESQERHDPASALRLAVVAADTDELRWKMQEATTRLRSAPATPFSSPGGIHLGVGSAEKGRLAFLFPGQGSQYPGMGADLAMHLSPARLRWDRFADLEMGDRPLHRVVHPGSAFSEEERDAQAALLTETEWAQPAVAAHSMALLAVLEAAELRPDCVAGHSLGELCALHAAGVFDAESLLRLARRRGELMREATGEPSGMLAVSAGLRTVEREIAALAAADLWPANHNAPEQVVVSGGSRSLTALNRRLGEGGVRVRPLKVSAAFHSPFVRGAALPLRDQLSQLELGVPAIPVYANVDAAVYPSARAEVVDRVVRQLVSPVRFAEQIAAMYADGVRTFVEVGPGSVLTGLVHANLGSRDHVAIALDRQGSDSLTALHHGLAKLIALGVRMNLAPLWQDYAADHPPARPRSGATVRLLGTNYGKPYPAAVAAPSGPGPAENTRLSQDDSQPSEVAPMPQPAPGSAAQHGPEATPGEPSTWLEIHRLAAATHASYQRTAADVHLAYLSAVDRSLNRDVEPATDSQSPGPAPAAERPAEPASRNGSAASGGTNGFHERIPPAPALPPVETALMEPAPARPWPADTSGFGSAPRAPEPAPALTPSSRWETAPVPEPNWTEPPPEPVTPAGAPNSPDGEVAGDDSLVSLTLQIIADKTGYPVEILKPDMHLQADLGVDSIKRVEVLSALRDRVEGLPTLDAAEVGRLQTIGEIAERLSAEVGG